MGSTAVLQLAAYKVLIQQLRTATREKSLNVPYMRWKVKFGEAAITVSNVWIQGQMLSSTENGGDEIFLDDGTGHCLVVGMAKIPAPKKSRPLQAGDSVVLIGHVMKAGPAANDDREKYSDQDLCAKIKVIKITNVTDNPNCKPGQLWVSEVKEAQSCVVASMS